LRASVETDMHELWFVLGMAVGAFVACGAIVLLLEVMGENEER
jgi:hypothetical protein